MSARPIDDFFAGFRMSDDDVERARTAQRVRSIINEVGRSYPMLSLIASKLNVKFDESTPFIAAVDKLGRMIINTDAVAEFDEPQLKFVVMHELFHVMLKHFERADRISDGSRRFSPRLWNTATDMLINHNLSSHLKASIDGMVTTNVVSEMTGIAPSALIEMSAEEIYDKLATAEDAMEQIRAISMGGHSEDGSSNDSDGDDSATGNGPMPIDDAFSEESADAIGKAFGAKREEENGSDHAQKPQQVNDYDQTPRDVDVIHDVISHEIDWKKELRSFIFDEVKGKSKRVKTWRRPSRKYSSITPISKGKLRTKKESILISVDASPSMDVDAMSAAASTINDIVKGLRVDADYRFFGESHSNVRHYSSHSGFKRNYEEYARGTHHTSLRAAIDTSGIDAMAVIVIGDMAFQKCDFKQMIEDAGAKLVFVDISYGGFSKKDLEVLKQCGAKYIKAK